MAGTITMHGVTIHTDKEVSFIGPDEMRFADGSYCCLRTGEIVNKGPGELKMEGEFVNELDLGKKSKRTFTLESVSSLDFILEAKVTIEPHDEEHVTISVYGSQHDLSSIRADVEDGRLKLENEASKPLFTKKSLLNVRGQMGRVTGPGSIVMMGEVASNIPAIRILVPKGMKIVGDHSGGALTIGEIGGEVNLRCKTMGGVNIKSATKLMLQNEGPSHVIVNNVTESAYVELSKEGSASVYASKHIPLDLRIRGNGNFRGSKFEEPCLHLYGSGRVDIKDVKSELGIHDHGSGNTVITNVELQRLTIDSRGSGNIEFVGQTEEASVTVRGTGRVFISHVLTDPTLKLKGPGRIIVDTVGRPDPEKGMLDAFAIEKRIEAVADFLHGNGRMTLSDDQKEKLRRFAKERVAAALWLKRPEGPMGEHEVEIIDGTKMLKREKMESGPGEWFLLVTYDGETKDLNRTLRLKIMGPHGLNAKL